MAIRDCKNTAARRVLVFSVAVLLVVNYRCFVSSQNTIKRRVADMANYIAQQHTSGDVSTKNWKGNSLFSPHSLFVTIASIMDCSYNSKKRPGESTAPFIDFFGKNSPSDVMATLEVNDLKDFDEGNVSLLMVNPILVNSDHCPAKGIVSTTNAYHKMNPLFVQFNRQGLKDTMDRIEKSLRRKLQSEQRMLVPTNLAMAISLSIFQGGWETPFTRDSKEYVFRNYAERKRQPRVNENEELEFMTQAKPQFKGSNWAYMVDNSLGFEVQVTSIPFRNDDFSFVVFMPVDTKKFKVFENAWTSNPDLLDDLVEKLHSSHDDLAGDETLVVTLPQFHISASSQAARFVQKMGMPGKFPGLCINKRMSVNSIIHEAELFVGRFGVGTSEVKFSTYSTRSKGGRRARDKKVETSTAVEDAHVKEVKSMVDSAFLFQVRMKAAKRENTADTRMSDHIIFHGRVPDPATAAAAKSESD